MPVRAPVAAAALLGLSLLAGCGQTGPLHLPDDAPAREAYLLSGNKNRKPKTAEAAPAGAAAPAPAEVPAEAPAPTTP